MPAITLEATGTHVPDCSEPARTETGMQLKVCVPSNRSPESSNPAIFWSQAQKPVRGFLLVQSMFFAMKASSFLTICISKSSQRLRRGEGYALRSQSILKKRLNTRFLALSFFSVSCMISHEAPLGMVTVSRPVTWFRVAHTSKLVGF